MFQSENLKKKKKTILYHFGWLYLVVNSRNLCLYHLLQMISVTFSMCVSHYYLTSYYWAGKKNAHDG